MFDPVIADLMRHLRECDEREAADEAIEARVNELMAPGGAYDPYDAENIAEAISEAPKSFYVHLSVSLTADDAIAVAGHIKDATTSYWLKYATGVAEAQLEKERQQAKEDRAADLHDHSKWTDNFGE